MSWKRWVAVSLIGVGMGWVSQAQAGDIKINLPRRSHMTPVQRLNQDGVEAVQKHQLEKAETLFYKAYLLDPDDPFTLNNLGYISELQGQVDRAQRFYALAAEVPTDAAIDRSSVQRMEGRTVHDALVSVNAPIEVSHDNVEAVRLLSQGRAPEVDLMLQKALLRDPHNIFTLNNMGVAKEMEGESQEALKYYEAAAAIQSEAAAVVTASNTWRGKPVNEMAAENARSLRQRMETQQSPDARLAELNLRGVSAINRNDLKAADLDFRSAYALDPNNAFALNNIGYVAEIEGDAETAQFFYDRARTVSGADVTVGFATNRSAEGQKLFAVAGDSDSKVQAEVVKQRDARRSQNAPIVLRHRDNTPVDEPTLPPAAVPPSSQLQNQQPANPQPQNPRQ